MTTLAVLLAALHAVLAVTATADKSMTSDEIAHLTAGQAYNTRADYRLQPENGNLPQRLEALPMTLGHVPLPSTSLEIWQTADVWNYGHKFFYEQPVTVDQWLFLGRAMIALVSALTALLVFFWSRMLWGWRGGFLSLVLYVFCPAFLAHGALATSDVMMTFWFLATLGACWQHLYHPGPRWATTSALSLGLAFVSKVSAVLLPPMMAMCGIVWAYGEAKRSGWRGPVARLGRTTLVHAVATWAIIWLFYGFRYSAFAPDAGPNPTFNHGWGAIMIGLGFKAKIIWWLKEWHLLPEAWLYGLTFVLQFSRARGAFMSGEYGTTGWVSFFPWAFAIKSTLPFLLIVSAGLVTAMRTSAREKLAVVLERLRPLTPLAVLFAVYWATSLTSHLNIGHRHILPTYPVLFIAAGWLGQVALDRQRPLAMAGVLLLTGWHVGESLAARPNYLAYFNEIVGGSRNGWRHLVDSSLDWGQDLPGLKRWLDQNARGEKVFLSYFGAGDPAYEGIRATILPTLPEVGEPRKWTALTPGVYAIGATMLQHVYSKVRGDWTPALEKEFQELRRIEPTLLAYQNDPVQKAALLRDVPAANWETAWKRYEQLRFARLCHYLRFRDADATIGHSMMVYRLTAAEIDGAVGGSIQQWRDLILGAASPRKVTVRPHSPSPDQSRPPG